MSNNDAMHSTETDYLVFSVKDYLIALPYHDIVQIVDSPSWTTLPNMPPYFRGVIEFMGGAIPLIDTRVIFSLPSLQDEVVEFVKIFKLRKQDHLNWVAKLIDCVDNDKEIALERNPHQCAFGKWYDTFKPNTLALKAYMRRFDKPHQAIHNLANRTEELIRQGQKATARQIIHAAEKDELVKLVDLFDGFEEQMEHSYQEYAIVVAHHDIQYALAADTIKYFETLDAIVRDVPLVGDVSEKLVQGIGRKKIGESTDDIIILNLDNIFDTNAGF